MSKKRSGIKKYGNPTLSIPACTQPTGFVTNNTDCDDRNPDIHSGVMETCNGIDDNCDGQIDEGFSPATYYFDSDGDGYGSSQPLQTCVTPPLGFVLTSGDCDDNNLMIHPGVTELCNGVDDNCDGQTDEGFTPSIYYQDLDGDNYGNTSVSIIACSQPTGFVVTPGDCDDNNPQIWPNSAEICNGVDDNCNGQTDEGVVITTWYFDNDGDNYGSTPTIQTCNTPPPGYVVTGGDCNDNNPAAYPGQTEICNGIDDNCNGQTDEGCNATLNLRIFIEGFYTGANAMQAVKFNAGVSMNENLCDEITVQLHDQFDPTIIVSTQIVDLDVNGNAIVLLPASVTGGSYYLALQHRNAIETWSKLPVTFGVVTNYDFTE